MASLETLPPDQRAVLQLVLQRRRSYDDIAQLLSVDRAAVRQRALAAFDALGPRTGVDAGRRALITDYLLGQLPPRVADQVRERLGESAAERAWARVLASEIGSLAADGLPEIPAAAAAERGPAPEAAPDRRQPAHSAEAAAPAAPPERREPAAAARAARADEPGARASRAAEPKRSSRTGGALLLALGAGAVIAVIVVVILLVSNGSSSSSSTSAGTTRTSTPTSTGSSTTPTPVAQINLSSPSGNAKIAGIAQVVRQGNQEGIVIAAAGVPANTAHDAYAVWLYKSPTQNKIIGFVNPGVGKNGRLSTVGPLPADAANYSELLVTLETQAQPKGPGRILLQGALSLGR